MSILYATASAGKAAGEERGGLELLVAWMTGSFSSARQAAGDEHYRDIRLQMWPIWQDRDDGPWLYVEQAVAGREKEPYRQRIYRLVDHGDGRYESIVFTLPSPRRFVGAWRAENALSELSPDSLALRNGCSIVLRRTEDGTFVGRTHEHDCSSELRGASYATSEVRIDARGMSSWDRGFDAQGHQVWGAEKGGYRFERLEP
jgi:hypothetical protein